MYTEWGGGGPGFAIHLLARQSGVVMSTIAEGKPKRSDIVALERSGTETFLSVPKFYNIVAERFHTLQNFVNRNGTFRFASNNFRYRNEAFPYAPRILIAIRNVSFHFQLFKISERNVLIRFQNYRKRNGTFPYAPSVLISKWNVSLRFQQF